MAQYVVPSKYYFRLHHVRPRFKNNLENVLLYVATRISECGEKGKEEFITQLNQALRAFPGNITLTQKTIDNWRTEISSLFGFIITDMASGKMAPSSIAQKLAESSDLISFFKFFCYSFQYPGGHIKNEQAAEMIEKGINFQPAAYILDLLGYMDDYGRRFWITKEEATHCLFNDLRVTTGERSPAQAGQLIKANREAGLTYNSQGDVIRYAGDILDYMYQANLLLKRGKKYYLNQSEMESIAYIIQNKNVSRFTGYDRFYGTQTQASDLRNIREEWFYFLSDLAGRTTFSTDIASFLNIDQVQIEKLSKIEELSNEFQADLAERRKLLVTKEIGDYGEALIFGHECERLKLGGRLDLIHKVAIIPNKFAIGYDIRSFEAMKTDELQRYIEVKTTISNTLIDFNRFNMSSNEWNTANTLKNRYFVYRLNVSRASTKLKIIQDPLANYHEHKLEMVVLSTGGVEIKLNAGCGKDAAVLQWSG